MAVEDAIYAALLELYEQMIAPGLTWEGTGSPRGIDGGWFDAGYMPAAVKTFVAEIGSAGLDCPWFTALGRGASQMDATNYNAPRSTGNVVREIDPEGSWYVERLSGFAANTAIWDADTAKWNAQHGMTLAVGTVGSITLHAGTMKIHERLARHWTNERLVTEQHALKGEIQRWKRTGANHLLDCYAMADTCASRLEHRRAKTGSKVWTYEE
jgi:hypothetical protein